MKRSLPSLLAFILLIPALRARTLEVRSGGVYTNLEAAAPAAVPGDTILFRAGIYAGGQFVHELRGAAGAPITLMAAPGEEVILRGGGNAWQLTDPAWLHIEGFILEGQTGNGLNIDDAGTFDTPAHHITIARCTWRGIDATGNNDQLKLSGLDSFEVRECTFTDGAAGGSMIDMVGCHNGRFTGNRFERAGSNCIQAKGGTRYITIERNTFIQGGARAINIGGSTDLQFFRPPGAGYESADIRVHSNLFTGSDAPVAFVGTVHSEVVNNTFWMPNRWAFRILQETTGPDFVECGENTFRNNVVVIGSSAASPTINVGPYTRPASFILSNNLWYNVDNAGWTGPVLPAAETNGIIGRDPMLRQPPADMSLRSGSPAIGAGYPAAEPRLDYLGRPFATPRSIGALEGASASSSVARGAVSEGAIEIAISGGNGLLVRSPALAAGASAAITMYDTRGRAAAHHDISANGSTTAVIPTDDLAAGRYLCVVRIGAETSTRIVAIR